MELIIVKDKRSGNFHFHIAENKEMMMRDMNIMYGKASWDVMKHDVTLKTIAKLDTETGTAIRIEQEEIELKEWKYIQQNTEEKE